MNEKIKHLRIFTKVYVVQDFYYHNLYGEKNPFATTMPNAHKIRRYDIADNTHIYSFASIPEITSDTLAQINDCLSVISKLHNQKAVVDFMDNEHHKLIIRTVTS